MNKYVYWVIFGVIFLIVISFSVKAYRGSQLKQKAAEIFSKHSKILGGQGTQNGSSCYYDSLHADQRCYISYKLSVPYDSKKFNELVSSLESEGWDIQSAGKYEYRQFFYERAVT